MEDWVASSLDEVYAASFIDAIVVKVRDVQVANRLTYATIGVSLDEHRDVGGNRGTVTLLQKNSGTESLGHYAAGATGGSLVADHGTAFEQHLFEFTEAERNRNFQPHAEADDVD